MQVEADYRREDRDGQTIDVADERRQKYQRDNPPAKPSNPDSAPRCDGEHGG